METMKKYQDPLNLLAEESLLTEEGEALGQIQEILGEINELDEEISQQVDDLMSASQSEPPEALMAFLQHLETGTRVHETVSHLLRIKEDWDILYTRICAFNEDDEELLEGLIPCLGDLLLEQPEGISERWVLNLEEFLDKQRLNVN